MAPIVRGAFLRDHRMAVDTDLQHDTDAVLERRVVSFTINAKPAREAWHGEAS
jgi:hypothetical protein